MGSWKVVVRIDSCNDLTPRIVVIGSAQQSELMGLNCDGLVGVGLQQTCHRKKLDLDLENQVGKNLTHLNTSSSILLAVSIGLMRSWKRVPREKTKNQDSKECDSVTSVMT